MKHVTTEIHQTTTAVQVSVSLSLAETAYWKGLKSATMGISQTAMAVPARVSSKLQAKSAETAQEKELKHAMTATHQAETAVPQHARRKSEDLCLSARMALT